MNNTRNDKLWRKFMIKKIIFISLFFLFSLSISPLVAQERRIVSIDFNQVDINVVIKFFSDVTGKNFIIDPRVKGKITVVSTTPITVDEAYQVFLSILEVNGFSAIPSGKVVKIIPAQEAKAKGVPMLREGAKALSVDQMITQVIHLKYSNPDDLINIIKPLLSKESSIVAYRPANDLIITDWGTNLSKIQRIINQIDVMGAREEIKVIPLKYANAKELSKQLKDLYKEEKKKRYVHRIRKVEEVTKHAPLRIVPDERINSLVLVGNRDDIMMMEKAIEKLDIPAPIGKGKIHVYYLKNADAEEIAKVLKELTTIAKKSKKEKKEIELRGEVIITADKATNSLVITASPQDYHILERVIKKLDIKRPQVFVEAAIIEISMDKLRELGVDWFAGGKVGNSAIFGSSGTTNTLYPILTGLGEGSLPAALATGLVFGILGDTFEFGGLQFPSLGALLLAMKKDSKVNILSTPHLLTTDNEEAEIVVANNIPIITQKLVSGESSTLNQSFSIERKDVGITLRITPQITEGNFVKLNIYQEVSGLLTDSSTSQSDIGPTYTKRSAKTTVVVKNNKTVIIGGLIKDNTTHSVVKIPFLGDIPLLGRLFRYDSDKGEKTNLVIFLTPHIIRESKDLEDISKKREKEMIELRKRELKKEKKKRFDFLDSDEGDF